jgi:hypothetical protein
VPVRIGYDLWCFLPGRLMVVGRKGGEELGSK